MKQQAATKGLPAPTLELRKLLPLTVLVGASLSSNADGFVALHVSDAVACKVQRKAALTLTLPLTLALPLALTLTPTRCSARRR